MMGLDCGIVLYNTPKREILRLIESLECSAKTGNVHLRIHVIDNSEAPNKDLDFRESKFQILPSRGNIGYGRAHNLLMTNAFAKGAEAYLALNPDGFAHPHMLGSICASLKKQNANALVEARQFPMEHPKRYDPVTFETAWCSGACLAIARGLWEQIGGFDDGFFMYCEDVDLSWRTRLIGGRCVIAPNAYFFHDVAGRSESKFANWHMALSMERLLVKWGVVASCGLRRRLDYMLSDVPRIERIRGSNPVCRPIEVGRRVSPANFEHNFGFSEMRWA